MLLDLVHSNNSGNLPKWKSVTLFMGLPDGSDGKQSVYNAGDQGSIIGSGRSPGEGNVNPFQYSCLENPMDRGALWATVHAATKSQTQMGDQYL